MELLMMSRKDARNLQSSNTNKVGIQCICCFYSEGICYDARSYDHKKNNFTVFVPVTAQQIGTKVYNHVAGFLYASAFFGHLRESIRQRKY
jgi:hypothetical protein